MEPNPEDTKASEEEPPSPFRFFHSRQDNLNTIQPQGTSRKGSAQMADNRRMARIFGSTSSERAQREDTSSDKPAEQTFATPGGSVSLQGDEFTQSVYSVAGTVLEDYPGTSTSHAPHIRELHSNTSSRPMSHLTAKLQRYSMLSVGSASTDDQAREDYPGGIRPISILKDSEYSFVTPDTEGAFQAQSGLYSRLGGNRQEGQETEEEEDEEGRDSMMQPQARAEPPLPPTPTSGRYPNSISSHSIAETDETSDNERRRPTSTTENDDGRSSLLRHYSSSITSSRAHDATTPQDKMLRTRTKTIQELIETERSFAQDMAITRDIWLARARGRELGEIMAALQTQTWTPPVSPYTGGSDGFRDSPVSGDVSAFGISAPEQASRSSHSVNASSNNSAEAIPTFTSDNAQSKPAIVKETSSNSLRGLRGFNNPFASSSRANASGAIPPSNKATGRMRSPSTSKAPSSAGAAGLVQRLPSSQSNSARPSLSASSVANRTLSKSTSHGSALIAALSPADIRTIFVNLEDVASFSETFLEILESAEDNNPDDLKRTDSTDAYGQAFLSVVSQGLFAWVPTCIIS